MAEKSKIEWCDATWQVASGCNPISEGCRHCYSARLAGTRLRHLARTEWLTTRTADGRYVFNGTVRFHLDQLDWMLRWRGPKNLGRRPRVFVADRSDIFHDAISDAEIDRVFAVMALRPDVDFLLLTKRAKRMREYLAGSVREVPPGMIDPRGTRLHAIYGVLAGIGSSSLGQDPKRVAERMDALWYPSRPSGGWPLPNVWLGVSAENQRTADERIPDLLATPAAVRFVSAEPLLGPIDLRVIDSGEIDGVRLVFDALSGAAVDSTGQVITGIFDNPDPRIDWMIVGGESGPGARPMHPDWARSLRDQCAAANVPYFFKQWGEHAPQIEDRMEYAGKRFHLAPPPAGV